MVNGTRQNPEGFGGAGNSRQAPPPPPPPHPAPTMEAILAAQTELLRQLVQRQQPPHPHGGHNVHPPQFASYQDFLGTQPPLFHKTEEPLDADAWIRTIESKFSLLAAECPGENKAKFAAQQLCGAARLWWDHYNAMLPADHVVT